MSEDEWLNISDLPLEEQEPFSRWLKGSSIYNAELYERWKAAPDKIARECHKGWWPLIDDCEKELAALGIENKHWTQIKEKFGSLRLHFDMEHLTPKAAKQAHEIALKFERQAYLTCEKCGSHDDVTTKNEDYIVTRCKSCHAKRI